MTIDKGGPPSRNDVKAGQLTVFKVVAFVAALFAVGGATFIAGRLSGHTPTKSTVNTPVGK